MKRPTPSRLLLALVLLSAIAASMKPLIEIVRTVSVMRAVPRGARRERLMGPFYASMLRIAREIPPNERLALFPLRPEHYDAALFFDYYVYPHPTRIYRDVAAYRADRNAPATIIQIGDQPVRRRYAEVLPFHPPQRPLPTHPTFLALAPPPARS